MRTMKSRLPLAGLLVAATTAGCSTTQTFVDYSRGTLYSTETVGNVPYVEVGPVAASQRGFFWNSCEELADQAVTKLHAAAGQHGGNTVSSVRWLNHADGTYSETPICTTGWGWALAPPVLGAFFPWTKATEVKGRLVYADETQLGKYRGEVARISSAWQAAEAKRLALAEMSDDERAAKEAAEKAAADKAAADKLAAEQAAAAAAARAAAEKAALDRELEQKLAAERAAAEKAEADRAAAAAAAAKKKKAVAKKSAPAPVNPSPVSATAGR